MGTERRRRRMRRSSPAGEAATGREAEASSGQEPGAAGGREAGAASDRETGAASGRETDVAGERQQTSGADRAAPVVAPRSPTPHDLAELGGTFAMTAAVADPDDEPDGADPVTTGPEWVGDEPGGHGRSVDDPYGERGLRGLVGGGSSQVTIGAAMRARDAARPTDADLAAAEAELVIVRRGWVPREDLPPRGPRR